MGKKTHGWWLRGDDCVSAFTCVYICIIFLSIVGEPILVPSLPVALWLFIFSPLRFTVVRRLVNMSEWDGGLPVGGLDREM